MVDLAHTRFLQHKLAVEMHIASLTPPGVTQDNLPAVPVYQPYVCTQCLTGRWHGLFPYLPYQPGSDQVCNPPFPSP